MIYKLKIYTLLDDNTNNGIFKDLYFDVSKIDGFYIPEQDDNFEYEGINILFCGDMITVKQEAHIVNYLTEKFVDKAIKLKK